VKPTTRLHLVPRSRMRGSVAPLPEYSMAWCSVKKMHRDNFTPILVGNLETYLQTSAFKTVAVCLQMIIGISHFWMYSQE
jgi:hypothetical protein